MPETKYVIGHYEAQDNILHLRHPDPIFLDNPEIMAAFFEEVMFWIKGCANKPYLLINYANLEIATNMTELYADYLKQYRPLTLGAFRYGLSDSLNGSFTTMAVRMGNVKAASSSNIFSDEAAARQALLRLKKDQ